jgi:glutathione synthase/RimK-type ligase-like ATP-grasp enzyme
MNSVWLLTNGTDENYYSNKALIEEFSRRGVGCSLYNFHKLYADSEGSIYIENENLTPPDLVFFNNSIKPHSKSVQKTALLLQAFKSMSDGTVFINDPESHIRASFKHTSYELLQKAEVSIPATKIIYEIEDDQSFLNHNLRYPLVFKPTDGFNGYNTEIVNSSDELSKILNEKKAAGIEPPFILQEYESKSDGLMLKVRTMGEDVKAVFRLSSPFAPSAFKADKETGHLGIAATVDEKLAEFCKRITSTLNIEVSWIDMFVSAGEYKFCEINVPGGIFNTIFNDVDFAEEIVDYCFKRVGEKWIKNS